MTDTRPPPPIPADADLRTFPFLPLDVARLRDSTLAATSTGEEFRAAVLLWCAAWHQVPAGSLPIEERELISLSGFGRDKRGWRKVASVALHGWVEHSDGRLYHSVITEKAIEAWKKSRAQKKRAEARWKQCHGNATACATADATADATAMQQRGRGRERGTGTRKREGARAHESPGTDSAVADPWSGPIEPGPPPDNDHDRWRLEIAHTRWAKALLDNRAKIGPKNWRIWQSLVHDHGLPQVIDACQDTQGERWPDAVEQTLTRPGDHRREPNPDEYGPGAEHLILEDQSDA